MLTNEIVVGEFLDEIQERADRDYNSHLHQAFVAWYVEAEFGKCDWKFTDGTGDGGIDALVWRPGERPGVVIIQSKFCERVGRSMLSRTAYQEFDEVIEAYYRRGEAFDEWLENVAGGLPYHYRKAQRLLDEAGSWHQGKKAFRLITTHTRRSTEESGRIPRDGYAYADEVLHLYRRYRSGATPRARDIFLSARKVIEYEDKKRGVTSYLFNAHVSDFRRYLKDNDVARLVARNIRYELGGRIGRDIRKTYEKQPRDFWYLHNGLTIVCDDLQRNRNLLTLVHPAVINGAQTLYAISHCDSQNSSAQVAIRAVVRGRNADVLPEDDEWLQRIIRGVNTQNRVHTYDLRCNEPEQLVLQRRFRMLKTFYERKRGEWREYRSEPRFKGFARLTLPALGKMLTAVYEKDGSGPLLVKRGVDELFEDSNYDKLFPSPSKVAYRFPKIYFAYRLHEFMYAYGYDSPRQQRRQRHAFWHSLWLCHSLSCGKNGVLNGHSADALKKAFDMCHSRLLDRRQARRAMKAVTKAVWNTWRKARVKDPENRTPVNFFKTKQASALVKRSGAPRCRSEVDRFVKNLLRLAGS
jgi:hypothetical protein